MEVPRNLAILPEKSINFGKSSGGKQEESHLRKLDTFNEIWRKNYFTKFVEGKYFSSFKTITKSEFQRRKTSLRNFSRGNDSGELPIQFLKELDPKGKKENFLSPKNPPGPMYLFGASAPRECDIREKEMAQKLEEIHQMIQRMHQTVKARSLDRYFITKGEHKEQRRICIGEEKEKNSNSEKKDSLLNLGNWNINTMKADFSIRPDFGKFEATHQDIETSSSAIKGCKEKAPVPPGGAKTGPGPLTSRSAKFESSCKLKRKLIPRQFMSSFETELGSTEKSFTEQIIFEASFVPDDVTDETPFPGRLSAETQVSK